MVVIVKDSSKTIRDFMRVIVKGSSKAIKDFQNDLKCELKEKYSLVCREEIPTAVKYGRGSNLTAVFVLAVAFLDFRILQQSKFVNTDFIIYRQGALFVRKPRKSRCLQYHTVSSKSMERIYFSKTVPEEETADTIILKEWEPLDLYERRIVLHDDK